MTSNNLHGAPLSSVGSEVEVLPEDIPDSIGQAPVSLRLSSGAFLKARRVVSMLLPRVWEIVSKG